MAERLARPLEERLLLVRQPQRVGADHAHAVGVHVTQALAEALQAGERAGGHVLVDAAVLGDACGQAHHLAQAVDDDQLAVRVARDHHVEAVGAQVDRRQYIRYRARGAGSGTGFAGFGGAGRDSGRHARAAVQAGVKEEPQPQVVAALGLRITNCAPSRPSR